MEENLNKVFELEEKLKLLLPYIKNKEICKVVKWAEEDSAEIKKIRKDLLEKGFLERANLLKEKANCNIYKKRNVERNILEVYRLIENELEDWRKIYLQVIREETL